MAAATTTNSDSPSASNTARLQELAASHTTSLKRTARKYSYGAVISHIVIVALIVGMIAVGYQSPVSNASSLSNTQTFNDLSNPTVDQIASANLAAVAAQSADVIVATNVANLSRSLNAKSQLAQTDDALLNKPQILSQPTGQRGIHTYVTKAGDTVHAVASANGVSDDSIRWNNNLTSDALTPGVTLKIPGTTGVIYTVVAGDTVDSLAAKYQADKTRILTYNDAEVTGLQPGQQIVIPGGIVPVNERPGSVAALRASTGAVNLITRYGQPGGGSPYAHGFCTDWAYQRRMQLGRPVGANWGDASSWPTYARAAGFRVDHTPEVTAVMVSPEGGRLGHVAVAEKVNPDGSVEISEMNYVAWNKVTGRTLSSSQASSYLWIHDRQ